MTERRRRRIVSNNEQSTWFGSNARGFARYAHTNITSGYEPKTEVTVDKKLLLCGRWDDEEDCVYKVDKAGKIVKV